MVHIQYVPLGEESLYVGFCLDELGVKLSVWNDVCVCRAAVWTLLPVFIRRSPSLFPCDDIITSRKHTHPDGHSAGCVCAYVSILVKACMHYTIYVCTWVSEGWMRDKG